MERSISPEEHLENLRIVLSTRDVELLVAFWYESWRLGELGEEVRERIMNALPNLAFDYGLALTESFREFVQAYDEMMFVKQCPDPLNRCLSFFAGRGDLRNVRIALKKGATKVDKALHKAAYGGHLEVVKFLLDHGATEVIWGLYGAAGGGHEDLVDFFLAKGADKKYGLYGALRGGHRELIERFLPRLVFEEATPLGENPSRLALLARRIQNDLRKEELNQAVYEAARGGQQEYVDFFLAKGADEYEALKGAVRGGHLDAVKYLLTKIYASIVLTLAARGGHPSLVKYLVENGYNKKVYLNIALEDAARGGHEEVIEYLLEQGADEVNIAPGAAKGGHFLLLEKYLFPITPQRLRDALSGAIQGGYPDLADWLIEKGADDLEEIALLAAEQGDIEVVELLREKLGY